MNENENEIGTYRSQEETKIKVKGMFFNCYLLVTTCYYSHPLTAQKEK